MCGKGIFVALWDLVGVALCPVDWGKVLGAMLNHLIECMSCSLVHCVCWRHGVSLICEKGDLVSQGFC